MSDMTFRIERYRIQNYQNFNHETLFKIKFTAEETSRRISKCHFRYKDTKRIRFSNNFWSLQEFLKREKIEGRFEKKTIF